MGIAIGEYVKVLDNGTAPERYKGKTIRIDTIYPEFATDEDAYCTWDNEDQIYYSFDFNQLEKIFS